MKKIIEKDGTVIQGSKKIYIDKKTGKRKVVCVNKQPSMTDQSFLPECNVNMIMDRYLKTGVPPHRS